MKPIKRSIFLILSIVAVVVCSFAILEQLVSVLEESDGDLTEDGYF